MKMTTETSENAVERDVVDVSSRSYLSVLYASLSALSLVSSM